MRTIKFLWLMLVLLFTGGWAYAGDVVIVKSGNVIYNNVEYHYQRLGYRYTTYGTTTNYKYVAFATKIEKPATEVLIPRHITVDGYNYEVVGTGILPEGWEEPSFVPEATGYVESPLSIQGVTDLTIENCREGVRLSNYNGLNNLYFPEYDVRPSLFGDDFTPPPT